MRVAILHDRLPEDASPDLSDNLVQAREVRDALIELDHEVETLAMGEDSANTSHELARIRPEVVFNLIESPSGQGRLIHLAPALLESLRLPYTGADNYAMACTSNKLTAKRIMREAGLPTPDWINPDSGRLQKAEASRYIIKSVWEHGSVGLDDDSMVLGGDTHRLLFEMKLRRQILGGECFAEAFIEGREFNLSLLGPGIEPEVLPPAEITFEGFAPDMARVVGYRAKWVADSYEFKNTPRVFDFPREDQGLLNQLIELSLDCWRLFGLRGWARVDFRVDLTGRPWILEVNANPCLTHDAGFMAAAQRAGLNLKTVVDRILNDLGPSIERRPDLNLLGDDLGGRL